MINKVVDWFKACYPKPSVNVASVQYGCFFEEVQETADATGDVFWKDIDDYPAQYVDTELTAIEYKKKAETYVRSLRDLTPDGREAHLDGLIDVIWTAITTGAAMGYDMQGALDEVCRANYSKFEDGKPVFDENGKVRKGKDYVAPDLRPFIGVLYD